MMRFALFILAMALALPGMAQNSCFTNADGTTLCSTSEGVITGNTNAAGASVYRDGLGRQLDFSTDAAGNARVITPSGKVIRWQQPGLGKMQYGQPPGRMAAPPPVKFQPIQPPPAQPWMPGQ